MKVYIEMADGSVKEWASSLKELEERIFELARRGYTVKVRVI